MTDTKTEEKKKTVDLGLLEEDDEFEEFPAEEWDKKDEDATDVNVWEDNWDDDTIEDDFSVQLRKFGRKRSLTRSPPLRSPEPVAKKVCLSSYEASPSKQIRTASNGHSNGNGATHEPEVTPPSSGRGSRRGRAAPAAEEAAASSPSRTPTRSSARLRSSTKK